MYVYTYIYIYMYICIYIHIYIYMYTHRPAHLANVPEKELDMEGVRAEAEYSDKIRFDFVVIHTVINTDAVINTVIQTEYGDQ